MYTHQKQIATAGKLAHEAKGALIMIHGRGGSAKNSISLANELNLEDFAIYAPQATHSSWYPYSFMVAEQDNQPALNSALAIIKELVTQIIAEGIPEDKIYFSGFSQGACLTLEFLARNAKRYGGAVAFTGGLIGKELNLDHYKGDFQGTPILITTGNPDTHVPLSRVEESVEILKEHQAEVTLKVFAGRPHTILQEELDIAKEVVFKD